MKTAVLVYLLITIGISVTGCASVGTNYDDTKVSQIKKGETMEGDLVQMFGKPQNRSLNSDGIVSLTWMYSESTVKGETFIPYAGAFVGGARTKNKTLMVTLGPDGKVTNFFSSGGGSETRGTTQSVPNTPASSPNGSP
jgi:outer membrane protein assembly factor BamE (lipoprotein component of BamABCDE complex)